MAEPLYDLVEESLGEAIFLWRQWERELTSLTRNLDEVRSWTEDRLQGAIDGVRVAGDRLVELASPGLLSEHSEQIVVSAGVLASSADRHATEALDRALSGAEGDQLRAMIRGLELLGSNTALRSAASVLTSRGPARAAALCRLKAFRRAPIGAEATTAFASRIPDAQADALRSTFHVSSGEHGELIEAGLRSEHDTVRLAAIEAGVCRGVPGAWEAATGVARALDANAAHCLKLLALLGSEEDHNVVQAALRVPSLQMSAVWALGHVGTGRAVDALLAGMKHERLARACGEAYCWITGADLVRDRLTAEEAEPEVPTFEDDNLDANLVPAPEALWPLPDSDAVREHWLTRAAGFEANVRHIHGQPVTGARLVTMVETGPMVRRPDLVLELRVRTRGKYDVETRAFSHRQRQMMAACRAAVISQYRDGR